MGRQWLHAKRAIVNLKKGQVVGKLVKEITVAAKLGGPDPAGNAWSRLARASTPSDPPTKTNPMALGYDSKRDEILVPN